MCFDVFLLKMSMPNVAELIVMRECIGSPVVLEGLLQSFDVLLINESIKLICVLKLLLGLIFDPGRL